MMAAALKGHLKTVEVLLGSGANTKTKNNDGLTASDLAIRNGHDDLGLLLIKKMVTKEGPEDREGNKLYRSPTAQ